VPTAARPKCNGRLSHEKARTQKEFHPSPRKELDEEDLAVLFERYFKAGPAGVNADPVQVVV